MNFETSCCECGHIIYYYHYFIDKKYRVQNITNDDHKKQFVQHMVKILRAKNITCKINQNKKQSKI